MHSKEQEQFRQAIQSHYLIRAALAAFEAAEGSESTAVVTVHLLSG